MEAIKGLAGFARECSRGYTDLLLCERWALQMFRAPKNELVCTRESGGLPESPQSLCLSLEKVGLERGQ
jgi:hypothetical protein